MRSAHEMPRVGNDRASVPDYSADRFVDREAEIELVLDKARTLSMGSPVEKRTVVFWGYKGTGRTWLLRHLRGRLGELGGVSAVYANLAQYAGQPVESAVRNLLTEVAGGVWRDDSERAQLFRQAARDMPFDKTSALSVTAAWLVSDVRSFLLDHTLVLLLDHVYEADHQLLRALEDELLAWLSACPRALLVMAGRGQSYAWTTPELRLDAEIQRLVPFDLDLTREQLEKQKPEALDRASEIWDISQGYPLGNWLLAARSSVADALSGAVSELLWSVPQTEREYLEAVCIVRSFNEDSLPVLLSARKEDPSIADWSYRDIREARDSLIATGLVRWQEDASGWVVDAAVGPIVQRHLRENNRSCWRRLHCAAYPLFARWAEQYPQERQRWEAEAAYHADCLSRVGLSVDQCA